MYGDTDEFPEAIVFEEDEWLVEGEKLLVQKGNAKKSGGFYKNF